jgi:hypothetical protein
VLKELYFTAGESGVNADEKAERILTVLDAITLDEATKDGEVIVDIEDFKVILDSSPYSKVQIHANAGDAKIEFSHKGVSIVDAENNIFSPAAGGYTKIVVTGNNWHPRQYTITYIENETKTGGGENADKESAALTGIMTDGNLIPVTDGLFTNGTTIQAINLPAGTGQIIVMPQAERGVTVSCQPTLTNNRLTLSADGLTMLYIKAQETDKADRVYTLILSVGAANYPKMLIAVPMRTNYFSGYGIDKDNDLSVYLRDTNGITEQVPVDKFEVSAERTDALGKFSETGNRKVTVTYTLDTTLTASYSVWVRSLTGYTEVLEFYYADNTSGNPDGRMRRNADGDFVIEGTAQNKVIHTIKTDAATGGQTYLLGRKDNEAVTLNLADDGTLNFRQESGGVIHVGTIAELNKIKVDTASLAGKYVLTANVDLLGTATGSGAYGAKEWTPIGASSDPFTGEFDGGNKLVSALKIETDGSNRGFFGLISSSGAAVIVKNVIASGIITGGGTSTGGIVGEVGNRGVVENCENRVEISATDGNNIGGVVGYIEGHSNAANIAEMKNCRNFAPVSRTNNTSGYSVGGVAGWVSGWVTVSDCINESTGTVYSVSFFTGGVAGRVSTATGVPKMVNCSNLGNVTSTNMYIGGVTGYVQNASITGCSNSGSVTHYHDNTGGVAGFVGNGAITACYNTGSVSGMSRTGGVIGDVGPNGAITACYNTGAVSRTSSDLHIGGVVGGRSGGGTITACYWDNSVAGDPANGIGNPADDTNATPFGGASAFPNVGNPLAHTEWGTGDGSGSGKYWKAGTTGGGQLPKLWFE